MEGLDQHIVNNLLDSNARFRMLYEEHQFFERQLSQYDSRTFLTPDEIFERRKLQKMKLAGKDEMHRMLSHFS